MHESAGYISAQEAVLIEKLREKVWNQLDNENGEYGSLGSQQDKDLYLVRWLRARDLNVEKATTMLLNSLQWRAENDVDNVLKQEVDPMIRERFQYHFPGTDHFGNPVVLLPLSQYDLREVVAKNKLAEFDIFIAHFFETLVKRIRHHNENRKPGQLPITQFTCIADVKNYPLGQLTNLSAMKKLFKTAAIYEKHFPEVLFRATVVNCPSYFHLFMTILKQFIAPKTFDKITLYSSLEDWKKEVKHYVDPAILPEQYGGGSF